VSGAQSVPNPPVPIQNCARPRRFSR
jgi:hypothetical protein